MSNPLGIMTLHIIIRRLSEGAADSFGVQMKEVIYMISYSFHLSTGKHSLTTCRKVSGASKHNLRKYESEDYDRVQIAILRGGDTNILDDVKAIYHREFDEAVAVHNAGKRKDR